MATHLWLEYRLELLKFCNGCALKVPRGAKPLLLFNDSDRIVAIDGLGMPAEAIDKTIKPVLEVEISQIDYKVCTDGYAAVHYYHPKMCGQRIFLLPRMNGDRSLRIRQANGRKFFSHDYTLDEITKGKVPSEQRVWQFDDEV